MDLVFSVFLCLLLSVAFSGQRTYSQISHCLQLSNNSEPAKRKCLKCKNGYLLDHLSISCLPILLPNQAHCLQKSIFEECMRCDCGYSLHIGHDICVPSQGILIGCEVFQGINFTCTRPKPDFSIIMEDTTVISIEYALGSNCELRDNHTKRCLQCHSGYKLTTQFLCTPTKQEIANQYFSYYSADGKLQSRHFQFIVDGESIFPKITNCLIQKSKGISNFAEDTISDSICLQCLPGLAVNQSKTACFRQPIDQCSVVADENPNVCLECQDNELFYLHTVNKNAQDFQQICIFRQQQLISDPTDKCVEFAVNAPNCRVCAQGFLPSFSGCILTGIRGNILMKKNKKHLGDNGDYYLYSQIRLMEELCQLFDESNLHCVQCKSDIMVADIYGFCKESRDPNCLITMENNFGCFQCVPLMYFNPEAGKCISISDYFLCFISDGISDACSQCMSRFYVDLDGHCKQITQSGCIASLGILDQCELCLNLNYLKTQNKKCTEITSLMNCLYSDGLRDACQKCKRHFFLDANGRCVLEDIQQQETCIFPYYYLDLETHLCIEFSFSAQSSCFDFHPTKNECLECYSGFYLKHGKCQQIDECWYSNGITEICYQSALLNSYIDEFGKIQVLKETGCETNMIVNQCDRCTLLNGDTGMPVNQNDCVNVSEIPEEISMYCYHLVTVENEENTKGIHYFCDLCASLFYPDQNGICTSMANIDRFCLVSDGRTTKCLLCQKLYVFNEDSQLCELQSERMTRILQFCKTFFNETCFECESLFFPENGRCKPISDPDCIQSSGFQNKCQICSGGYQLQIQVLSQLCVPEYCEELNSLSGECLKCFPGYFLITSLFNKFDICQRKFIPHCLEELVGRICNACEPGYSLSKITLKQTICLPITIPNCLSMDFNNFQCVECQEGFSVLRNGQCFKIMGCEEIELHDKCMQCKEDYYLDSSGVCMRINDCKNQLRAKCLQCNPGYYLNGENQEGRNNNEEEEPKKNKLNIQQKFFSFNYTANLFEIQDNKQFQQCSKIPNCLSSDGYNASCLICQAGFELLSDVCVRNQDSTRNIHCIEFAVDLQIEQLEANQKTAAKCIQCQNLFYIQPHMNNLCGRITEYAYCLESDGITDKCVLCDYLQGYVVDSSLGQCEWLNGCMISNGIDTCVLCKSGDSIPDIDGHCTELTVNISNCIEYSFNDSSIMHSYQKFLNPNQILYFHQDQLSKPVVPHLKPRALQGGTQPQESSKNEQEEQDGTIPKSDRNQESLVSFNQNIICTRCPSFYSLAAPSFLDCQKFSQQVSSKCILSDGIYPFCDLCEQDYQSVISERDYNIFSCSHKHKKNAQSDYFYCFMFNIIHKCVRCYRGFYMDSKMGICKERNPYRKCQKYHPTQDRCEECMNGYILKEIKQENTNKMLLFCQKLDSRQEVKHCSEYKPNTNICVKCQKYLEQDIVEFVLDEVANTCEDVLHLMCKAIDSKTRQCQIRYVANCQEYKKQEISQQKQDCVAASSKCAQCQNGYFLGDNDGACYQHIELANCLIYSQHEKDTCNICQPLYFLDDSTSRCQFRKGYPNNCKNYDQHSDRCLRCAEGFILLSSTSSCIPSDISNCVTVMLQIEESNQQHYQLCLECLPNYIISSIQNNSLAQRPLNSCLFQLKDANCKVTDEHNHCKECKRNYLLNHQGVCVETEESICSIDNCKKYSQDSHPEDNLCQECNTNSVLDTNYRKCMLLTEKQQQHQESHDNQTQGEIDKENVTNADTRVSNDNSSIIHMLASVGKYFLGVLAVVGLGWIIYSYKNQRHYPSRIANSRQCNQEEQYKTNISEIQLSSSSVHIEKQFIFEESKQQEEDCDNESL